jgi:hypothetical protein
VNGYLYFCKEVRSVNIEKFTDYEQQISQYTIVVNQGETYMLIALLRSDLRTD